MAMNTLVIGYGNSLRGDDCAIACHQLTSELAERISQAHQVVFVDVHAGVPAGPIAIQPVQPRPSAAIHLFDPETLRAWPQQIYAARRAQGALPAKPSAPSANSAAISVIE
jgi:hypothetical protein